MQGTFLSNEIHIYGLIIGLAVITGMEVAEFLARRAHSSLLATYGWQTVLVGFLGARLYHVFSSWQWYWDHPENTFAVWQGGMSIIGGVFAAVVFFAWRTRSVTKTEKLVAIDCAAVGLAVGQILGRVGNFVNQELYGLPTSLPWAVFIEESHRYPGYMQFGYYHPLFAYEMLWISIFLLVWIFFLRHQKFFKPGTGSTFVVFVWWYVIGRIFLDELRIDKTTFFAGMVGVNQVVLLLVLCVASYWLWQRAWTVRK